MVSEETRQRYLQDPWPIRVGGLAADLARVASFAGNPANAKAVASLLEEGKYFAEWAAPEAPEHIQIALADTQRAIVQWEQAWNKGQPILSMRTEAEQRAEELLKLAGLI